MRMNPKVSAYFTPTARARSHALEDETGHYFSFTGSEGLPLDHFAVVAEGPRSEIEEQSVPFREGEEVHVDIVEPHMYSEDDAVAKVDGYLIEVVDGIEYVGEKVLVRIEEAGRTSARAVLAELAEEAAAATDRAAQGARAVRQAGGDDRAGEARSRRSASPRRPRTRPSRRSPTRRACTPGPARRPPPRRTRRRRSRAGGGRSRRNVAEGERDEGAARLAGETDIHAPSDDGAGAADEEPDGDEPEDGDDAVQSKPRRRGRRGGRRRSRAKAEPDAAEVSDASE